MGKRKKYSVSGFIFDLLVEKCVEILTYFAEMALGIGCLAIILLVFNLIFSIPIVVWIITWACTIWMWAFTILSCLLVPCTIAFMIISPIPYLPKASHKFKPQLGENHTSNVTNRSSFTSGNNDINERVINFDDYYRYSECGGGDLESDDWGTTWTAVHEHPESDNELIGMVGLGDLTCDYNANSAFLRCAVHPGAETCEGCRDYIQNNFVPFVPDDESHIDFS